MYCAVCGRELKEGAKFCGGCGTKVELESVMPPEDGNGTSDTPETGTGYTGRTPVNQPVFTEPGYTGGGNVNTSGTGTGYTGGGTVDTPVTGTGHTATIHTQPPVKKRKKLAIWAMIVGALAVILQFISVFMPMASVTVIGYTESVSFAEAIKDEVSVVLVWVFLFVCLAEIIFFIARTMIPVLILDFVNIIGVVVMIISFSSANEEYWGMLDKGVGYWLYIIMTMIVLLVAILGKVTAKRK